MRYHPLTTFSSVKVDAFDVITTWQRTRTRVHSVVQKARSFVSKLVRRKYIIYKILLIILYFLKQKTITSTSVGHCFTFAYRLWFDVDVFATRKLSNHISSSLSSPLFDTGGVQLLVRLSSTPFYIFIINTTCLHTCPNNLHLLHLWPPLLP